MSEPVSGSSLAPAPASIVCLILLLLLLPAPPPPLPPPRPTTRCSVPGFEEFDFMLMRARPIAATDKSMSRTNLERGHIRICMSQTPSPQAPRPRYHADGHHVCVKDPETYKCHARHTKHATTDARCHQRTSKRRSAAQGKQRAEHKLAARVETGAHQSQSCSLHHGSARPPLLPLIRLRQRP